MRSRNRQNLPHHPFWLRIDSPRSKWNGKIKVYLFSLRPRPKVAKLNQYGVWYSFILLLLWDAVRSPSWLNFFSDSCEVMDTVIMREAVLCLLRMFFLSSQKRREERSGCRSTVCIRDIRPIPCCSQQRSALFLQPAPLYAVLNILWAFALHFISWFCSHQSKCTSIMKVLRGEQERVCRRYVVLRHDKTALRLRALGKWQDVWRS